MTQKEYRKLRSLVLEVAERFDQISAMFPPLERFDTGSYLSIVVKLHKVTSKVTRGDIERLHIAKTLWLAAVATAANHFMEPSRRRNKAVYKQAGKPVEKRKGKDATKKTSR